jgi:hypothetical protein
VTLVKKLFLNKILESSLYVLVQQELIQLQIMIAQIVWKIVKLVQMRPPATLANQHPPRQFPVYFPIVNAQLITLVSQIIIVYLIV